MGRKNKVPFKELNIFYNLDMGLEPISIFTLKDKDEIEALKGQEK